MKSFALACSLLLSLVACAAEPVEPTVAEVPEPAALEAEAALAAAPAIAEGAGGVGTRNEAGNCLNYCNGRPPFSVCVPVCRRELEVYFPLEPIELIPLPTCGDNICQLPLEADRSSPYYCRRDCRWQIVVNPQRIFLDNIPFAEASINGLSTPPSAFDIKW